MQRIALPPIQNVQMQQLTLSLSGMSCGHCVNAVKSALTSTDGVVVENVAVGSATLQFDPAKTDVSKISAAVEEEGYKVLSASTSSSRVIA